MLIHELSFGQENLLENLSPSVFEGGFGCRPIELIFDALNQARLAKTKPDSLIMHPGPVNRGVEIDRDIADSNRSLILEQVTNGIAVRIAVLFLVNGGKGAQEVAAG